MRFSKFFFLFFFLKLQISYAQQLYPISDPFFLQYLHDSMPQCLKNDSLIIDSAHHYPYDIIVNDEYGPGPYSSIRNIDGIQFFDHIHHIWLYYTQITALPHLVSDSLYSLNLYNIIIPALPMLDSLPNLQQLTLYDDSNFTSLPDLSRLKNLSGLEISIVPLDSLPPLDSLIHLNDLSISQTMGHFHYLPELYNNKQLTGIEIENTALDSMPPLDSCLLLAELNVSGNNLYSLPSLKNNTEFSGLNCAYNHLSHLPNLSQNTQLTELYAYNNLLDSLPDLSLNPMLETLQLDSNRLTTLPDLINTNLSILNAPANRFTTFPHIPSTVHYLNLSHNLITDFPLPYQPFVNYWLLKDNLITSLPAITTVDSVGYIDFSENKLDFSSAYSLKLIDGLMVKSPNYVYDYNYYTTDFNYTSQKPFGDALTVTVYTYNDTFLTITNQHYADSYQWYHNDTAIAGEVDTILHIYCATQADGGTYNCHSIGQYFNNHDFRFNYGITEFVSEPQTVVVSSNIGKTNLATLYPAVSSGSLKLKYSLPEAQDVTLKIYDLKGSLVYDNDFGTQAHSEYLQPLDLSGLASGSYIAQVQYSLGYRQAIRFVVYH